MLPGWLNILCVVCVPGEVGGGSSKTNVLITAKPQVLQVMHTAWRRQGTSLSEGVAPRLEPGYLWILTPLHLFMGAPETQEGTLAGVQAPEVI